MDSRFQCARMLIACLALLPARATVTMASEPATDLADVLASLQCEELVWVHCSMLGSAVQFGIPTEAVQHATLGFEYESLPRNVFDTLKQGSLGIEAWVGCLHDQRETRIVRRPFFGESSPITVAQAALAVLAVLVPLESADEDEIQDEAEATERLIRRARQWQQEAELLQPNERMTAWFKQANDLQRRRLLVMAIIAKHGPAYPLLEADFLARADNPDDFLLLDVSAYIRHRRTAAEEFRSRIARKLRPKVDEQKRFFLEVWQLLTRYDTIAPAIDDWVAGRIEFDKLVDLVERSVDMAWAYHSMPIEPVFVHRPIMEANLRDLIGAAHSHSQLEIRWPLLNLAESAASVLSDIILHTSELERTAAPDYQGAEWAKSIEQLRALMADRRSIPIGSQLHSPCTLAARIVLEFWGPSGGRLDPNAGEVESDWRERESGLYDRSCDSLLLEAAAEALSRPEPTDPLPFPEQRAVELAGHFVEGDAAAFRRRLELLSWQDRLLVHAHAKRNRGFAERMWPLLLQFVDYRGGSSELKLPDSFVTLWTEQLAGEELAIDTWKAMQNWMASEEREGRAWHVVGQSFPCRPGITLHVFAAEPYPQATKPEPEVPHTLEVRLFLGTRIGEARYQVVPDGVELVEADDDEQAENALPPPVELLGETRDDASSWQRYDEVLFYLRAPPGSE